MNTGNNRTGVGRACPPAEHRFQKGRSGNPAGRPKKARDAASTATGSALHELVLTEASRVLAFTEDGRPVQRSVAEAVLMKTWMTAVKGNAHAQRTFLQLVAAGEAKRESERAEQLRFAYELKFELEAARDERVKAGRDEWSMRVHPSDVEIDVFTSELRLFIPLTDEDWAARAFLLRSLDHAITILARAAVTLQAEEDDPVMKLGRESALMTIALANVGLPPRLRRSPPDQFRVPAKKAALLLERLAKWPAFQSKVSANLGRLEPD